MQVGFFTVFRRNPEPFLQAAAVVRAIHRVMPDVIVTQLTDDRTPEVPGVDAVRRCPHGPMLERRLEHYAACQDDDWLLIDTDVELRADVREVFPPTPFDVALTDRHWPHLPQGDAVLQTMPFNTGVVFCRNVQFWADVLAVWRGYSDERRDWLSEQRAVWEVVRTGRYLVQILPGMVYNYPPKSQSDPCDGAKIVHYKGHRKAWWTAQYYTLLRESRVEVPA